MLFRRKSGYSLTSMLSSSCPTLNAPVMSLTMKYLNAEGQIKSVENITEDNLTSHPNFETGDQGGLDDVDGVTSRPPQSSTKDEDVDEDSSSHDRTGTVDSTEEFLQGSEDSGQDSEDSGDRRQSWTSDDLALQFEGISRTSLDEANNLDSSLTSDLEYLQTYSHPLGSRSYSLTSLLEESESGDESVSFSRTKLLKEFSVDCPDQIPTSARVNIAAFASQEDSTDSGSGIDALSPTDGRRPDGDYSYHTDNDLPQGIMEPGYKTNPDLVLVGDVTTHSTASPDVYAREHKPHKAKLRNDRIHSSMSGFDDMLHKPATRHGVTRKTSFMNFISRKQKQSTAQLRETDSTEQHRQTDNTDKQRLGSLLSRSDTSTEGGPQILPNTTSVPCQISSATGHNDTCTERLVPCDRGRRPTNKDNLGSSQRNHESLDPNVLSSSDAIRWGVETMREHRPTNTLRTRQMTQNPTGHYTEQTQPISGMTKATSEPCETTDGLIPWLTEEADLQLTAEELGDHIYTVDATNVKKVTEKDERQSRIRELISTERHYVTRLKIMQKVFAHSMITKLKYTEDQVNKLFPGIDELVEIHEKFLHQLVSRQDLHEDKFVHEIADILLDQFQGEMGEKMISVYGVFFCKYKEAMQLYKEILKNDRSFQIFVKYCHSLPVCEKREIPDFCLGVTIRLSKYWMLIEGILKKTKDKKERKILKRAVEASKNVLHHMDKKVDAYEKLIHIQSRMDSKIVTFKDKKFKRQDLNANNRELVHVGIIGWMSAQGRVAEILAVVLTDIIVFLQRNEQKYTFFMQDKKSCIIPLHDLLVREKADVKGSLGIYVISQNPAEMYELVCKSNREREEWIRILQLAIKACRKDVGSKTSQVQSQEMILSKPVDINRKLEVASKVAGIIEQLHHKDEIIRECCDDKNKLMLELLQLSTANSEAGSVSEARSRPGSQEMDSLSESVEIVLAAMQEASRLTGILQSTDSNLSRSISLADNHTDGHVTTTVPRRAETFSGFDSSRGSSKILVRNQTLNCETEEKPTDTASSSQELIDRCYSDTPDTISESQFEHGIQAWDVQVKASCAMSSEHGSMNELSASNILSLVPAPPTHDQMASAFQLVQYLHSLLNITAKQCTMVESLRAELEGAKEEISRLSADVHSRQSTMYRHDQMEELRHLQENLTLEKHEWEKRKLYDCSCRQAERENLETERRQIERDKLDLRNEQKSLKRERDVLHNEYNKMKIQALQASRTVDNRLHSPGLQNVDGGRSAFEQRTLGHHRSASEDMFGTVRASESYSPYAWVHLDEFPYQPLESSDSLEDYVPSTVSQDSFPDDFIETDYDRGVTGVSRQNSQLRADTFSLQNQESAAISSSPSSVPRYSFRRETSAGLSRVQSLSAVSRIPFRQKKKNSGSSDASKREKFSQPKGQP